MSSHHQPSKSKPTKPPPSSTQQSSPSNPLRSSSSNLSSHLAMVELKQKILTSLSKLGDRDTYQIAVEDLEKIIQSLSPESVPMLLNCLYDSANSDPKLAVKKESIRLLAVVCNTFPDYTQTHLTKIIANIVKRLKDSDSGVKDACQNTIGALSGRYLRKESGGDVVGVFVKPLFEAMGEQNKGVQSGAAMCMAKMVEGAAEPPVGSFQKLCPRICKLLNNLNFTGKASLLPVVGSLSQVGAIAPQSLEPLLQSIHDCLGSPDWPTRKAAAEALSALALNSSYLIADNSSPTLAALEACRFDKIKPVRDSMAEAFQLWKNMAGQGDTGQDDLKASPNENNDLKSSDGQTEAAKQSSNGSSPTLNSLSKGKGGSIPDKAVVILKKKGPALSDKEINPEFFQKLEKRVSDDLPVEVVVPRRLVNSSNSNNGEEPEPNDSDLRGRSSQVERRLNALFSKNKNNNEERVNGKDSRNNEGKNDTTQKEPSATRAGFSKTDGQSDGSMTNNKGNWLAIQRQLLQLERQQSHLMNMLQEFMGGSHDSMITLENRVRGLERIVEDLARDLSVSSGRRGGNFGMGFDGSSNRPMGKFNSFQDYPSKYIGRAFGDRFVQSDGVASGMRGRGPWRSDVSDARDFPPYGSSRNGQAGPRRAPGGGPPDVRSPKAEHENDQIGSRRGAGPFRYDEGPSARSVWQASKDEATLEAIRIAGEDSGASRSARVAIPELTAEAMGDDNIGRERDPVWNSWTNAMDALQVGDLDTAYSEVVSSGDDLLLVKLMDRSGPVCDQLSNETANEVLQAISQFLLEQNLFDICLSWTQQLVEIVMENGPDVFGIPMDLKKDILLNLHEASSTMDPPEEWEGATPDQLLLQLASAWGIEVQQHDK